MMKSPRTPDIKGRLLDPLLKEFLIDGRIERVEGGYNWTKKEIRDEIKRSLKLKRYLDNPFWRLYYIIFGF